MWSEHDQTRHQVPSRFGLCHRPVNDGASRQWVDCKLWSNTKAQHREGSMKKPGLRSPGWGITGIIVLAGRRNQSAAWHYGHALVIFAALNPPTPLPFKLVPLSPVKK